jgi:hypothetical protein
MDNRSYDPDKLPEEHLEPGPPAEGVSKVLGEHHEQPVPVDPLSGIVSTPGTAGGMAPQASSDAERASYPEYVDKAIDSQIPHSANQPTGPAPPETSAHPPHEGGYQYGQSPYTPDAYAPGPGSPGLPPIGPSEERGKGFNWLACCGIGCGIALVLVLVGTFVTIKYFKPLINAGIHIANVSEEVRQSGAPDSADVTVSPEDLAANPEQFENQWVQVTGKVSDDPDAMVDAFKQQRGMQETAGYLIGNNIVVLDVSGSEAKAQQGDTVTVIGKPVVLDFSMLGPFASTEVRSENELGDIENLIFLITDDVAVGSGEKEAEPTFP